MYESTTRFIILNPWLLDYRQYTHYKEAMSTNVKNDKIDKYDNKNIKVEVTRRG